MIIKKPEQIKALLPTCLQLGLLHSPLAHSWKRNAVTTSEKRSSSENYRKLVPGMESSLWASQPVIHGVVVWLRAVTLRTQKIVRRPFVESVRARAASQRLYLPLCKLSNNIPIKKLWQTRNCKTRCIPVYSLLIWQQHIRIYLAHGNIIRRGERIL